MFAGPLCSGRRKRDPDDPTGRLKPEPKTGLDRIYKTTPGTSQMNVGCFSFLTSALVGCFSERVTLLQEIPSDSQTSHSVLPPVSCEVTAVWENVQSSLHHLMETQSST
ncbi:hypothetical protein ROHU_002162 [Labeo rohita]|uniref:Uncharacterized protein n=1 Tax=Labeo rohita TaxID=84645 RepID=A0A498NYL0_LABRO|nr:hypothetical protein ROHU_002162 [Labeo rohita]